MDYSRYGYWLKRQFSHQIKCADIIFIYHILKIRSREDLIKYRKFWPMDWKNELGEFVFRRYIDFIIELVIIWEATSHINAPMLYSNYMAIKEYMFQNAKDMLYGVIDVPLKETTMPRTNHHNLTVPYTKVPSINEISAKRKPEIYDNPSRKIFKNGSSNPVKLVEVFVDDSIAQDNISADSSSSSITSRKSEHSDGYIPFAEDYYYAAQDEMEMKELQEKMKKKSGSLFSSSSVQDRKNQASLPKLQPQFDKVKWNGIISTFRPFKKVIEGHLLQVGAGYLFNPTFLDMYKEWGTEVFKSDNFWKMFKIPMVQAIYDGQYLFGILLSATVNIQHKIILKHEESQDGILAWYEFKQDFDHDGCLKFRLEQSELLAQKPFTNKEPGGMASYIDKFQCTMVEIDVIAPQDYSDFKKKRMLLANVTAAEGVFNLIQKCRDDKSMTYDQCATYLRKNSIWIDNANMTRSSTKLMHRNDSNHDSAQQPEKSVNEILSLFQTMANEGSLHAAYRMFNTRTFRETMSISDTCWKAREPIMKSKVKEIRKKLSTQKNRKRENIHPDKGIKSVSHHGNQRGYHQYGFSPYKKGQ